MPGWVQLAGTCRARARDVAKSGRLNSEPTPCACLRPSTGVGIGAGVDSKLEERLRPGTTSRAGFLGPLELLSAVLAQNAAMLESPAMLHETLPIGKIAPTALSATPKAVTSRGVKRDHQQSSTGASTG